MKKFNDWLALKLTAGVGSMTCAWLFFIWSILPLVIPSMTNIVSYVSQSIIQLVLLSVIMVGQDLGGRNAETRAQQDHKAIMLELKEIKAIREELRELKKQCHSNQG